MDARTVAQLASAFDTADALRQALMLGEWEHAWCRSACSGFVTSSALPLSELESLAALGCRVAVRLDTERLHMSAVADRSPTFALDVDGEFADVTLDPTTAKAATEAVAAQNLERLLPMLVDTEVEVEISVLGVEGLNWVASSSTLLRRYESIGWLKFATLLKPAVDAGRLVILDAGDDEVHSPGWVIHGSSKWPKLPKPQAVVTLVGNGEDDLRVDLPAPVTLVPFHVPDSMRATADALRSTAASVALLGLADSIIEREGGVSATFHGIRSITLDVVPADPDSARPCVALWEWVADESHPGRRHAAIQAITMQVETPHDFYNHAGVIHDTSQFLFAVAQSGLVQEAMAARRGARDSAIAAARSAADRARLSARSAVDRALVTMGAGIGIVLANRGDLIERDVAVALLMLASVFIVGSGVLAFAFELPGATSAIRAYREDLEHQTEVLTQRDVEQIRSLPSLLDALRDIKHAKRAVLAIIGTAIIALTILFLVLFSKATANNESVPGSPPVSATTLDH